MLVNANFQQTGVLIVLLEYIDLFQSEWQHETNIWEGLNCFYHSILLYFILSIAIITNVAYFAQICSYYVLCFCLPIIPVKLLAKSMHPYQQFHVYWVQKMCLKLCPILYQDMSAWEFVEISFCRYLYAINKKYEYLIFSGVSQLKRVMITFCVFLLYTLHFSLLHVSFLNKLYRSKLRIF